MAAVDLGLHYGAKVIATSASSTKRDFLSSYGAHYVLPASGFKDKVKEFTNGYGADIIYDPVGGDVFDESVRCIGWNGRLLIVGFTLSLIHISEPTRRYSISYAVFCLKKIFFLMIRRPPRSTPRTSSAASDVYKRQIL